MIDVHIDLILSGVSEVVDARMGILCSEMSAWETRWVLIHLNPVLYQHSMMPSRKDVYLVLQDV